MTALIELRNIGRSFVVGNEKVEALKGVDLAIEQGEFVALVGASGSGKSTLMSILGCLDSPTAGTYFLGGQDVSRLDPRELAQLRRRHFGFVFQRYHLLDSMSALSNVEVPAVYEGVSKSRREARARDLLTQLGLGDRLAHRPMEMSGGQQQRVSIARALMNGGEIILADEPTGALDSKSGAAVLDYFKTLHTDGHTIIIVTHDMAVARYADRIVQINDGQIDTDQRTATSLALCAFDRTDYGVSGSLTSFFTRAAEATRIAIQSIVAHRLRSVLTLFGIIVGIVAVIAVVGLGEGGQRIVLAQINSLGANSISILPGRGWDDENARNVDTLIPDDAVALAKQSYVNSVSPLARDTGQIMFESRIADGVISGVSNAYFDVARLPIAQGSRFTIADDSQALQEAIIDANARQTFFGSIENPVGHVVVVKGVPLLVVGVTGELSGAMAQEKRPQVFVPYMSLFSRISGTQRLSEIVVRVEESVGTDMAEQALTSFMEKRHGARDFFTFNSDQMRRTIQSTTRTLSILVSSIGAVALLVGGVGVMNIMLVSVTERTNEIGVRMAVGARPSDILLQFLIEALVITIIGSGVGVALAVGLAALTEYIGTPIPMVLSLSTVVLGCVLAVTIGAVFGFFPARKAARLKPIQALSRD